MNVATILGGSAVGFEAPIIGDGNRDGGYDYAATGWTPRAAFSSASTQVMADAIALPEDIAYSGSGVAINGRLSAGVLAVSIVGIVAFYIWTRKFQK
jgi:hypothetical protein